MSHRRIIFQYYSLLCKWVWEICIILHLYIFSVCQEKSNHTIIPSKCIWVLIQKNEKMKVWISPKDWYLVLWKTWNWGFVSIYQNWGHLPFTNKYEVVFPFFENWGRLTFKNKLRSSSIYQKIEIVFHLQKNWGCLPCTNQLRLSSITKKIIFFHLQNKWGCLPFTKKIRSSSINK